MSKKTEHIIWSLADKLRGIIDLESYADEIAVFVAWIELSKNPELGLAFTLDDLASGKTSLQELYNIMARLFVDQAYERAKLPSILDVHDVKYFIKELRGISYFEKKELIYNLFELEGEAGSTGSPVLPWGLVRLIVDLSKISNGEVYAPFLGSQQLALEALFDNGKIVTYTTERNTPLSFASSLVTGLLGRIEDPFQNPVLTDEGELKQFSNVVMFHPFGLRVEHRVLDMHDRFSKVTTNGDVLAVEHALSQCSGRLVAVVPPGLLFRGANDYDLRVQLVNSGILEAVIQLPGSLLSNTSIPAALIVIDKSRERDAPVFFYDANQNELVENKKRGQRQVLSGWKRIAEEVTNRDESSFGIIVNKDVIIKNKYDLSVRKYVLGKASANIARLEKAKPLSDIADLIRGQLLKEEKSPQGEVYYEAGVRDIGVDGYIQKPKKRLQLTGRMKDRAELQRLQKGDILLVTKGSVGKVGIVGEDCEDNWVASQNFQVVRLKHSNIVRYPEYLYMYLSSPLVQAYFGEQVTGTTIPMLKTGDVKELPVPVMDKDEQQIVAGKHGEIQDLYKNIGEINKKIDVIRSSNWSMK